MFKKVSIDSLGDLSNGEVRKMIDREISRAVLDMEEAPEGDDAPRKVVIQAEFVKEGDQVAVTVKAQAKLPAIKSGTTSATARRRAGIRELVFQDTSPDSPDQASFDDVGDK